MWHDYSCKSPVIVRSTPLVCDLTGLEIGVLGGYDVLPPKAAEKRESTSDVHLDSTSALATSFSPSRPSEGDLNTVQIPSN